MKDIIINIIKFILSLFKSSNTEIKPVEEPIVIDDTNTTIVDNIGDEIDENNEEMIDEPITEIVDTIKVEDTKANAKQYQTYLQKLGFYTKSIDGIVGKGTKTAIKQFNITFLNSKSEEYSDNTDKILKIMYNAYCDSLYMTDDLWKYFKNFKKSEFKCHCNKKYCNGYPHKIAIRSVMAIQYIRNYYNKSVSVSSGLRCQKWNDLQSGSVKNSKHIIGRAVDLSNGLASSTIRKAILELPFVYYSYDITKKYIHISVTI